MEMEQLRRIRVVLSMGRDAFEAYLRLLRAEGIIERVGCYRFVHGRTYRFDRDPRILVASYHFKPLQYKYGNAHGADGRESVQDRESCAGGTMWEPRILVPSSVNMSPFFRRFIPSGCVAAPSLSKRVFRPYRRSQAPCEPGDSSVGFGESITGADPWSHLPATGQERWRGASEFFNAAM